jgi:MarR-like DNA-binding transcriptional regulator SgrR of sgrS sRNA
MGFFSRLFKFREQDPASPETTWAYEGNASELLLEAEQAAALLAEFDIDAVIRSHENLKWRLQRLVEGQADEVFDPVALAQHESCALGQWLCGPGRERLGRYPAFDTLVARHQYFHLQAARMVQLHHAGEYEEALHLFHSSYRHASNQVALLLKELRRSLGK